MTKKKVSFDIDQKLLSDIKSICKVKGIKLADFFREASLKQLENEKIFMTILVPHDGTIEKFTIEKRKYDIDLFEASETMKINVDAKCEGVIRFVSPAKNQNLKGIEDLIFKSIEKKIAFYTTEKYPLL